MKKYWQTIYVGIRKIEVSKVLTIGVTGHRSLPNEMKLKVILQKTLRKLLADYDGISIVSPLAEGADRLFVETAFTVMPEKIKKLVIPMPFDKERYVQDFATEESKQEFKKYFEKSNFKNIKEELEIDSFMTLHGKDDNEAYMNVGKCVANNSDILIAIWDGKEANGAGGTGDVIAYAKKKRKAILHINTDTLKVDKINFEGIL